MLYLNWRQNPDDTFCGSLIVLSTTSSLWYTFVFSMHFAYYFHKQQIAADYTPADVRGCNVHIIAIKS